jgi:hypothetical protein
VISPVSPLSRVGRKPHLRILSTGPLGPSNLAILVAKVLQSEFVVGSSDTTALRFFEANLLVPEVQPWPSVHGYRRLAGLDGHVLDEFFDEVHSVAAAQAVSISRV